MSKPILDSISSFFTNISMTKTQRYQNSLLDLLDDLQKKMEPEKFQVAIKKLIQLFAKPPRKESYDEVVGSDECKWQIELIDGINVWTVDYPFKKELYAIAEVMSKARLDRSLSFAESALKETLESKLDSTLDSQDRISLRRDDRLLPEKYGNQHKGPSDYYHKKVQATLDEMQEIIGESNTKSLVKGILPYYLSNERETSNRCKNLIDINYLDEIKTFCENAEKQYYYLVNNMQSLHQNSLFFGDFSYLDDLQTVYLQDDIKADNSSDEAFSQSMPHGCSVYNPLFQSDFKKLINSKPNANSNSVHLAPLDDAISSKRTFFEESAVNPVIGGICTTVALVWVIFKMPNVLGWAGQMKQPHQKDEHALHNHSL